MNVLVVPSEIQHWIANKLAWPVPSCFAAAVNLDNVRIGPFEVFDVSWERTCAQREHRLVLYQNDRIQERAVLIDGSTVSRQFSKGSGSFGDKILLALPDQPVGLRTTP